MAVAASLAESKRNLQTDSASGQGMTATVAPLIGGGDLSAPDHFTPPSPNGLRDMVLIRAASTAFLAKAMGSASSLNAGPLTPVAETASPHAKTTASAEYFSLLCMSLPLSCFRLLQRFHVFSLCGPVTRQSCAVVERHLLGRPDMAVIHVDGGAGDAGQACQLLLSGQLE